MSFLPTRLENFWPAVTAAAGVGSFAFPLIAPWHLVLLLIAAIANVAVARSLLIGGVASTVFVASVLVGYLPSPLATGVLAAIALTGSTPLLAVAILLLQTSILATIVQLVAQPLFPLGLEVAAPALVAVLIVGLCHCERWALTTWALIATFLLALAARNLSALPSSQMICVSIPACALAAVVSRIKSHASRVTFCIYLSASILALSWLITPPRSLSDVYVLLPNGDAAPEGRYFKNYHAALKFSGISSKEASDPEEIPNDAVIMIPWLTAPLKDASDANLMERIGELARERRWTVVLAAEHNDLGGSAKRIATLTRRMAVRNDLTVPPGNTDDSGPLHVSSFRDWPHEAILNRGASVKVSSLWDKVLLSGDGWWAERDIGEWLWVGDYIWQRGDRTGRLALSVAFDDAGARWVIVGDNSPLLNNQIYADPRPLILLLQNSTLWPAFLKDLALLGMLSIFLYQTAGRQRALPEASLSLLALLFPIASFASAQTQKPVKWQDTYLKQSGFDQRNFNEVFAEYPAIWDGRRVIRIAKPISKTFELPEGPALIFAAIEGSVTIGNTTVKDCRRLGSLQTSQGPYLMDAQACLVQGNARVVLGSQKEAAVIEFNDGQHQATLVLDTAFLAQNSPAENIKWLLNEMTTQSQASGQR